MKADQEPGSAAGQLLTDNPPSVDPYACQVCNCHHHTTEQHDDPPTEPEWWHDY